MTYIETTTLSKTVFKNNGLEMPCRRYLLLWDMSKPDIEAFIEQATLHHLTIEFTSETFDTETAILDKRNTNKYLKILKRSSFRKKIKELLLNFLQSEDDYVEVSRLIKLFNTLVNLSS